MLGLGLGLGLRFGLGSNPNPQPHPHPNPSANREAVDQQEVGQVLRPGGGRVVDNEHELWVAEQPLQRLRRAVERRVPSEHLVRVRVRVRVSPNPNLLNVRASVCCAWVWVREWVAGWVSGWVGRWVWV